MLVNSPTPVHKTSKPPSFNTIRFGLERREHVFGKGGQPQGNVKGKVPVEWVVFQQDGLSPGVLL